MILDDIAPYDLRRDPITRALLQALDAVGAEFTQTVAAVLASLDIASADQTRLERIAKILAVPFGTPGSVPIETLRTRVRVKIARDRSNGTAVQFEQMLRLLNPTGTVAARHEAQYTVVLSASAVLTEAAAREQIQTLTPGANAGSRLLLEVIPEDPFCFDGFDGLGWGAGNWCDQYEAAAGATVAVGES